MRRVPVAAAAALLSVSGQLLAGDAELPSTWRRADITVDGVADEWTARLVPIAGQPVSLGVLNDGSFLYVVVKTSDEGARKKILGSGLCVYLDGSAKDQRAFGIRFPVGRVGRDASELPDSEGIDYAKLSMAAAGRDLEVLGRDEGDVGRLRVADARPIEAAVGDHDGALVVELKVPLAFSVDSPHAIETAPGRTISVGLETSPPKPKRSGEAGRGGFGMHGGRGGGGRGGGGRGGPGGGRAEAQEAKALGKPLKVWLTVPLATDTTAAASP